MEDTIETSFELNYDSNLSSDMFEDDSINCFVCNGSGKVSRKHLLKELGGKDILNLLAMNEEGFFKRLEESAPKLIMEIKEVMQKNHIAELDRIKENYNSVISEKERYIEGKYVAQLKTSMEECAKLKARLEIEVKAREIIEAKHKTNSAMKGNAGEKEFRDWIGQYPHLECSEKLVKTGDYCVKMKRTLPNGNLEVIEDFPIVVDCKRDLKLNNTDIDKMFRDAKLRGMAFAYMVVDDKNLQFRGEDHKRRVMEKDGVLLFKGDRANFLDDLAFLEYIASHKTKADDTNYKEKSDKLYNLIFEKVKELDEFKNHASNIVRESEKIVKLVDQKKHSILQQLRQIMNIQGDVL